MINKRSYTPPTGKFIKDSTKVFIDKMCYSLESDYGDDIPIEEVIQEAVDNGVPIYHDDIYEGCVDIAGWVEDAVYEGLYCFPTHDPYRNKKPEPFELEKLLQAGWYMFLNEAANYNMDNILANWLINIANSDPRITEGGPAIEDKVEEIINDIAEGDNGEGVVDTSETFGYYRKAYLRRLYEEGISTIDPDEGKEDEE